MLSTSGPEAGPGPESGPGEEEEDTDLQCFSPLSPPVVVVVVVVDDDDDDDVFSVLYFAYLSIIPTTCLARYIYVYIRKVKVCIYVFICLYVCMFMFVCL